ncbi:hypothetical protein TNCV_367061 [Trichonephila clavipes]|nr:hypothetical protein TNCV_367061 [Trichonephila clavipes]
MNDLRNSSFFPTKTGRVDDEEQGHPQFLADKRIIVLEHPPYSPDFASYDFYLFPKVKNAFMGTKFQSVGKARAKTVDLLKVVTPNEPQHCFAAMRNNV